MPDAEMGEMLKRLAAALIDRGVGFSLSRGPDEKWSIAVHDEEGKRAMEGALLDIGIPREDRARA